MNFFKLNKEVSETTDDIDADDVLNIKNKLKNFGYYNEPDYGMTKITDTQMFDGIRNFQKDKNLKVDGIMKPDGETEGMFNKLSNIAKDYIKVRNMSKVKSPLETGNIVIDKGITPKIPLIGQGINLFNKAFNLGEEVSNIENTFRERQHKRLKK